MKTWRGPTVIVGLVLAVVGFAGFFLEQRWGLLVAVIGTFAFIVVNPVWAALFPPKPDSTRSGE